MNGRILSVTLLFVVLILCGCGGSDGVSGGPNTDPGLTPGGAQDFNYVRNLINSGIIPQSDDFVVEGLLSEYDLPIEGDTPQSGIGIKTAAGYSPDLGLPDGGLFLQMGFSSSTTTFSRKPLNVSIVLDISGSMNSYEKLDVSKRAITNIVNQLNQDNSTIGRRDILSIVLFNNEMHILQQPDSLFDHNDVLGAIEDISAGGSTNMDLGLKRGYNYVHLNVDEPGFSHRVFLFTDALPNTGNTDPEHFEGIVSNGANEFIGLTAVGVGIDFDNNLVDYIGNLRGGNYFYMDSMVHADSFFTSEFDYIVTPVAYNVNVAIQTRNAFRLSETYGFPSGDQNGTTTHIPTLFFSRRKGGVLLRFSRDPEQSGVIIPSDVTIAEITVSYRDTELSYYSHEFSSAYGGEVITSIDQESYEQEGVRLGIALTREVATMQHISEEYYASNVNNIYCIEKLQDLREFLVSESNSLSIASLHREVAIIDQLINNFESMN